METLKITSLNAAVYITLKTGVIADIIVNPITNYNHFEFKLTEEVKDIYQNYCDANRNKNTLQEDIIEYNRIFKDYTTLTKALR